MTSSLSWIRYGAKLAGGLKGVRAWQQKSILIIKSGSLGDALLFTGGLRAIRHCFPEHRIVLVCSLWAVPVFERSPDVNEILTVDEMAAGDTRVIARLRRLWLAARGLGRDYDMALLAESCAAGADGWAAALFNQVVSKRKVSVAVLQDVHELDKTVAVLHELGCEVTSRQDIWPDAGIREDDRDWAREVLGKVESRKQSRELASNRLELATARSAATGNAEINTLDLRLQTTDCGLVSTSNAQHPTSNIQDLQSSTQLNKEAAVFGSNEELGTKNEELILSLCPGARFKQKQWGAEKYAELLTQLGSRFKIQGYRLRVLILGGPEDREIAGEIIENTEKLKSEMLKEEADGTANCSNCANFSETVAVDLGSSSFAKTSADMPNADLWIEDWTEKCTLHQSFALIEESDLCIGNDTLGLHVAVAVGTPSVVIMWGGDGDQWIPWGDPEKHRMVRFEGMCPECDARVLGEHTCMERISVGMVLEEVTALL